MATIAVCHPTVRGDDITPVEFFTGSNLRWDTTLRVWSQAVAWKTAYMGDQDFTRSWAFAPYGRYTVSPFQHIQTRFPSAT